MLSTAASQIGRPSLYSLFGFNDADDSNPFEFHHLIELDWNQFDFPGPFRCIITNLRLLAIIIINMITIIQLYSSYFEQNISIILIKFITTLIVTIIGNYYY